jgi:hypothetical protein
MTRKTVGYVKLAWTCDRCDGENPGPRQFCNACGAPQPADVEFHQPVGAVFLTKPDEIEAAKAGADVHCPYCGARNPAVSTFCGACGGSLAKGEKRATGKILGSPNTGEALPIICPSCGTHNLSNAMECAGCGDSLAPERAPAERAPEATDIKTTRKKGRFPVPFIVIGVVLCIAVAGIFFLIFGRTEETIATVESVSWTRSVPIEVMGEVESEDWWDELPEGAQIQSCEESYRFTQDEPAPNSVEVCGTPYTVDQGSGYGEVVQDCVYEIYEDWCSYTTIDWVLFDTLTATGDNLMPYWPSVELATDQRTGEVEEEYRVSFSGEDRDYSYSTEDEFEFYDFTLGSEWALKVNAVGGIVSLEPAR